MAKTNYDAINFKNKDVDKLSGKFNNGGPATTTPAPAPAYTKGKQSNFAGTDRKREPVIPEAKPATKAVSTVRGAGNVTPVKVENKSRLERKMDKYGVEPASSNNSPSQQKEINKNRLKLAKDKERAAIPTPGMDKVRDKVNKVLGRGKYDKGSMGKNMSTGGNKSKVCVDKFGQKQQEAGCKISMAGKFKQAFKKQKPVDNSQWTISK